MLTLARVDPSYIFVFIFLAFSFFFFFSNLSLEYSIDNSHFCQVLCIVLDEVSTEKTTDNNITVV